MRTPPKEVFVNVDDDGLCCAHVHPYGAVEDCALGEFTTYRYVLARAATGPPVQCAATVWLVKRREHRFVDLYMNDEGGFGEARVQARRFLRPEAAQRAAIAAGRCRVVRLTTRHRG